MEVNQETLAAIAGVLQKTLCDDLQERKTAEKSLESVERNQNYAVILLTLVDMDSLDMIIRVSASITFKNFIKRNWRIIDDEPNRISDSDRSTVKSKIVDLMLKMPEQIQRQLSDAISIIGREDFPDKWHDLLPQMVSKFSSGDFHVINGVLRTAHSLFKRYRHEFKSQTLWTEIKLVLDNFAAPITELMKAMTDFAEQHENNADGIKVIYSSITLIAKLFYSLNFQDLPEYFEDHIKQWMDHFHKLLTKDIPLLHTTDEDEVGPLELLRSQICDNVALYAQKYDEEFQPFLPDFVTAIWNLLVTTNEQVKYDLLVSKAIQFLASVAERPHYKNLFESQDVLTGICEKVIISNMNFRPADEELFEDNPDEYIRRDIEGSDIDTRRRSACDLVGSLCKFFEEAVITIFSGYVQLMLQEYAKNPAANWKSKDMAIYLVTSLASKSKTAKHGTTETRQLVNIADFFNVNIAPDLVSPNIDDVPVLKADAIKYLMTFRSVLPPEIMKTYVPRLITFLTAQSPVVNTYAAHALERTFTVKTPEGKPVLHADDIKPHCQQLMDNLFLAMNKAGSEENEYAMKALMRSFSLLQENIIPYQNFILKNLTLKLKAVSKNPSKPHFNHYLFESLCLSIRICCKTNSAHVNLFEQELFPPFQEILLADVQEFVPYVFQIMSILLEKHDTCPQAYMELFPHLLLPVLWERTGNIPPLVRLLMALIQKGPQQVVASQKLGALLGVFQKLIASKNHDHEGFYILESMIEHINPTALQDFLGDIFMLLFQRLTSSKTTKYVKNLLVFFSLYAVKYGSSNLITIVDGIQPKMFGMVIEKLFLLDMQKISGHMEKKICAVGVSKILTEAPAMLEGDYLKQWTPLLQALVGLFELPEDESIPDDEHFIEIEETPGYQAAYSQLAFAGKKVHDPFAGTVDNPKLFLAQSLSKLSSAHPGKLPPLVSTLDPAALQYLQVYIQQANVSI
ncbi:exportin-2-like [Antedon mediterranea]|uniref:exportin-2-like n=1 Tax=Antedon mediterranea TaxID=105859 RepID=UPI003AF5F86B